MSGARQWIWSCLEKRRGYRKVGPAFARPGDRHSAGFRSGEGLGHREGGGGSHSLGWQLSRQLSQKAKDPRKPFSI